jgi:hypothetical protein
MTPEEYDELIALLDGRIDKLTKPLPSQQMLRLATAIDSAYASVASDGVSIYGPDDYSNLLEAHEIVREYLPPILEQLRAKSIDPDSGWSIVKVEAANGDCGRCAICRKPFQHFDESVVVHTIDMHSEALSGVCRPCVREYAPDHFTEDEKVSSWLSRNRDVCDPKEQDRKRERQRVALIDAIREHAHSTHYRSQIVRDAPEWSRGAFGEWR